MERRQAPPAPHDMAPHTPESDGAARVAGVPRSNQVGGSNKPPGEAAADYDTYCLAVMVKWRINPRDPPESVFPMSPGRLGMVLKKAFGDFRVSYIKDEG